jgi:hypothetical protein
MVWGCDSRLQSLTQFFTNSWLVQKKFKKSASTWGEFQIVFVFNPKKWVHKKIEVEFTC